MKGTILTSVLAASALIATCEATETKLATGTIDTYILFQHSDTLEQVKSRNIILSFYKEGVLLGNVELNNPVSSVGGHLVTVEPQLTEEERLLSYGISISGLEQGEYSISLSGKYHCDFKSEPIILDDTSKQLTISTQSGDFTYGDLNYDDAVDEKDLLLLETNIKNQLHTYDLTGDSQVDISDLALVKMNLSATGSAILLDTHFINLSEQFDLQSMEEQWENIAEITGNLADLFVVGNQEEVVLTPVEGGEISEENPLIIPFILEEPTELSQIELSSTTLNGGVQQGFVEVVYENGETEQFPFSSTETTARTSENVVVISLGARVVVKTITVTVERVEGDQYAVLKEVNFVKDLVPENPQASNGIVEKVEATAGDKSVTLKWGSVNNVSGYRVHYGTSPSNYTSTLNTSGLSATISGLNNFQNYYFAVTSTHDDWSSGFSSEVKVMPIPSSIPGATEFLEANPINQGASLRWKSNSSASFYNVYCKKMADTTYNLVGITSNTSLLVGDLLNGEEYSFYIRAVNSHGEGASSNVLTVIPDKEIVDGPDLPTLGRIPNSAITDVVMQDPSNVKTELYPNGFSLDFITDEDYSTDWVADLWYKSSTFTFRFDQAYDMSYLVYVGKLEGNYRSSLDYATVNIWTEEDDLEGAPSVVYTDSSIRHTNIAGETMAIIDFPRSNVAKISVMVAQWNGSPTNVSLSEIVFYEHNEIDDDIHDLFGNNTYTQLKEGVTQGDINDLRLRVDNLGEYVVNRDILARELDMAEELLQGNTTDGLILTEFVSIDNRKDDPSLSDISPLGVLGFAGNQVTIYADIPEGEVFEIIPSQYYSEAFDHLGTGIVLESGRNVITVEQLTTMNVTKGGALYYRYSGDKSSEITLHIDRHYNSNGVLDLATMPVLSLYDFYDLSEANVKEKIKVYLDELDIFVAKTINSETLNPTNSTEISLRNVLLSLPATEVHKGLQGYDTQEEQIEGMYHTILAWEELLKVCNVAYGLDNPENPREARQNIRYMRMSDTAFMYAAGNHIGIQYGSVSALMQGKPTTITGEGNSNALFGWGIAHEIGHNLDRLGRVEITNNIYSLLAQTYDGAEGYGVSRLSDKYSDIYAKVTSGNEGIANNVFVQLGMYWQLQQAYCDENPLEFYNLVNKTYKNGLNTKYSGDERFAVAVSHVVQKDLSDFFMAWGLVLSNTALAEMGQYTDETRHIQYFNDHSREYRLTDSTGISGGFSGELKAVQQENQIKNVDLTIAHTLSTEHILGYEWYRNGVLIGFTSEKSYTDTLGSLNNASLEYSVKIIDKLGKDLGTTLKAEEFRIEYDNIIDSDLYTVEAFGEAWKYTFKTATPLSAVIFYGEEENTSFVVDVYTDSSDKITAKKDNIANIDDKSFHYFNKPNVDSQDTRIGTYDVTEVVISGIEHPEKVEFVGYIGDNVSLMEQPVGVLAENFDTGVGIIEEGTIVVLGEYLGDPYFTEITLLGNFSHSHGVDGSEEFEQRAFAGTTYLIGYDSETVSTISDGLFIFVPDIQNEEELQGEEHTTCTHFSLFPAELKAIMERSSDTGNYQTSDTVWVSVPTEDSMPLIYID